MRKGVLAICLLYVSLLCCGYSYRGEWSKATFTVNEDYVEASNDYSVVGLPTDTGYKYVQLPCSVQLFEDAGYLMLDEKDTEFRPWTESWASRAYDESGRYLTLHVKNDSDDTVSVAECNVYNIGYDATEDKEVGVLPVTFGGLSPTDKQTKAYELFGANDSKYDVGGITYVTWETSKEEYTLNLEYDTNDAITKLKVGVDESDKEYGSVWDYAYEEYTPTTKEVPTITPVEMPPEVVGPFVAVFLGGLFAIFAIVLLVVIKHHKRKLELQQEAINLQYLNADIDSDVDDDLLDKYNEKV